MALVLLLLMLLQLLLLEVAATAEAADTGQISKSQALLKFLLLLLHVSSFLSLQTILEMIFLWLLIVL